MANNDKKMGFTASFREICQFWSNKNDRVCFALHESLNKFKKKQKILIDAGGTRTHNLQIRSLTPYPLGHSAASFQFKNMLKYIFQAKNYLNIT